MIEIGSRRKRLPAPPHIVWESLTQPHRPGARPWLELAAGEVEPEVREADEPHRLVWSSLWPDRPEDRVEIVLERHGLETQLGFRLLAPGPDRPDADLAGHRARRLSELFFAELRYSFGQ